MLTNATMFEGLLEAVPDACVGVDHKGLILFVNHQTESLFGYDRIELIGQPIEMMVPGPGWHPQEADRVDPAHPSNRTVGLELIARQRDGTQFAANIHLSYLDTGHVLMRIAPLGEEIKHGPIVKAAQLMAAIVADADDAIISRTFDGIVTSWNDAAERMYGYSSKEIKGKPSSVLVPEDLRGDVVSILARIRAGEHVKTFETTRIRKDGRAIRVAVTASKIRDPDGSVVGVSVIGRGPIAQK